MEIILGARTVNEDIVQRAIRGEQFGEHDFSSEVVPAAYARISRDPKDVTELRKEAAKDVLKARKSNSIIFFDMGHESIAEHGYFSFDVKGISRLGIEALEKHRISTAYTEMSQRYITLDGDYLIPNDLPPHLVEESKKNIKSQNKVYHESLDDLLKFHEKNNPDLVHQRDHANKKKDRNIAKNTLEGWAKEDARYVVSMATLGQLGFSTNIRELGYIIRTMRQHPLDEVKEMGEKFYKIGSEISPSLLKYCDAVAFEKEFGKPLQEEFMKNFNKDLSNACNSLENKMVGGFPSMEEVELLSHSGSDDKIIAALISKGKKINYQKALDYTSTLNNNQKKRFLLDTFDKLTEFDKMPREFELLNYTFKIITSATEFAQLKRHRMLTLLPQPYDPYFGMTYPKSVAVSDLDQKFRNEMNKASKLFYKIREINPSVAEYALTNAHKRENIVETNLRELYAFSRLRQDGHAQWEIRNHAHEMTRLAQQVNPLTTMFLGGKDKYQEIKASLYK